LLINYNKLNLYYTCILKQNTKWNTFYQYQTIFNAFRFIIYNTFGRTNNCIWALEHFFVACKI
jgi:hypothetical protein